MHSSALGAGFTFHGRLQDRIQGQRAIVAVWHFFGQSLAGLGQVWVKAWRIISVLVWEFARLQTVSMSRPLLAANNPTKVDIQTARGYCSTWYLHSP